MKDEKFEFELTATIDYVGHYDYWCGHDHAFAPKNLVGCIVFDIPMTYKETVDEVIEGIIYDVRIQMYPINVIDESYKPEVEEFWHEITDEQLRQAIQKSIRYDSLEELMYPELAKHSKLSKSTFFYKKIDELPRLVGFFHIYVSE